MLIHNPQPHSSRFQDAIDEFKLEVKSRLDHYQGYRRLLDYAERRLGYRPNLQDPKTYNDKVNWRKIYDHNPLYPKISDKILLRDEIVARLGQSRADEVMTELYATTDAPYGFDFKQLPASYAAKANHASGWNVFVTPDDPLDETLLRDEMARWLRRSYGKMKQEWAYQPIKRQVMFEEFLETKDGRAPDDMKFMFFNEECHFVLWDDDRFGEWAQHYLHPNWTPYDFHSLEMHKREIPTKPALYEEMLELAQVMAKGFDSIRVDFLFTDDRIVLNELTLYRGSGMNPFHPPEWDRKFGDLWTLPQIR